MSHPSAIKTAPMIPITKLRLGVADYAQGRGHQMFVGHKCRYAVIVAHAVSADGATGLGVAWSNIDGESDYAGSALSVLRDLLLGRDSLAPYENGELCQRVGYSAGIARAASVVELALWDLAGRQQNIPTYKLLGQKRNTLPAYVVNAEEFDFTSVSQYVDLTLRHIGDGFRAFKLHLWGQPRRDIEACRAIRDAVGNDIVLMLDPISRYSREDALRVGQAIGELGYARFEDPISPDDVAGYRWLSSRLQVPIAANESLRWGLEDCAAAARSGIVQGLRLEVGRSGFVHGLKMAAIAAASQVEFDIASFAPRGGVEACLHMGLAGATTRWFEHHTTLGLDEVPGLSAGLSIDAGMVRPSGAPGFGFDVDWNELDKYTRWQG